MSEQRYVRAGMPANLYGDGGILTPAAGGQLYQPRFDPEHYSVFRILPAPHMDVAGQLEPWRVSRQQFGQWYLPIYTIKGIGLDPTTSETWVVHNGMSERQFNMNENPVAMMRAAINRATKARHELQGWPSLVQGSKGQSANLPAPSVRALLRVQLYIHNKKANTPPFGQPDGNSQLAYMLIQQTAWESLTTQMNVRQEGTQLDPGNPNHGYAMPDPIDPRQGVFWVMYMRGHDPRQKSAPQAGQYAIPQQQSAGDDFKGMDCHYETLWRTGNGDITPALSADQVNNLIQRCRPWNECVHVLSPQEQVTRLCRMFRRFSGAIVYALDDMYGADLDPVVRAEGLVQLGRGPTVQTGVQYQQPQQHAQPMTPGVSFGYGGAPAQPGMPPAAPAGYGGYGGYPQQPGGAIPAPPVAPMAGGYTPVQPGDPFVQAALDASQQAMQAATPTANGVPYADGVPYPGYGPAASAAAAVSAYPPLPQQSQALAAAYGGGGAPVAAQPAAQPVGPLPGQVASTENVQNAVLLAQQAMAARRNMQSQQPTGPTPQS